MRRIVILAALALTATACGLKGDLYFPEPQTQEEADAVKAEDAELDSEDPSDGNAN